MNAATVDEEEIAVDPRGRDASRAWLELKKERIVEIVKPLPLSTPQKKGFVRFVCVSDTHNKLDKIAADIPMGDVLIHAGDFTYTGAINEIVKFNNDIGKLPHPHKIVIAGNHELSFDRTTEEADLRLGNGIARDMQKLHIRDPRELLTNCTYLEDEECTVMGYRIYGSPWQPRFGGWAFNLSRGYAILQQWNKIPAGTEILVTHGPPLGHGDLCKSGLRAGCLELLNTVEKRVKPLYHIFGHIHEGYGITTNGEIVFINASTCNIHYRPVQSPVIFDLPRKRTKAADESEAAVEGDEANRSNSALS